jgi:hypothetical protein
MHPVQYEAVYPQRQDRLSTLIRLILVIPHLVLLTFWAIAVFFVTVVAWFAIIFFASYPEGMWGFCARFMNYYARVSAYAWLQVDPYPAFGSEPGDYPASFSIERPERSSRPKTIFRAILVIPAHIVAYLLGIVVEVLGFISWLSILITGSQARGIHQFIGTCLRFTFRTYAYFALLVDAYPNFSEGTVTGEEAPGLPIANP